MVILEVCFFILHQQDFHLLQEKNDLQNMKQKTFYEKKDINILSLEFSKTEHWYIHIQSFQDQRKSASKDRHFIKNSLIMYFNVFKDHWQFVLQETYYIIILLIPPKTLNVFCNMMTVSVYAIWGGPGVTMCWGSGFIAHGMQH